MNVAHEAVTLAWNGLYEAWVSFVVFQGAADLSHGVHQSVFRDEGIFPNGIEKLLLFDYAATVFDQEDQGLQRR